VTEAGSDTAAATGDVFIAGTLAATESASDTAALSGDVFIAGALSATETGTDTAAVSGDVLVAGSISAIEAGDDTFEASSDSGIQGDLAATESGEDGFAADGRQPAAAPDFQPLGGGFAIPSRQQMAELARKQRIALGILPKPVQKKAKQAAKVLARQPEKAAQILESLPVQQRIEALPAIQSAYLFYFALEQSRQRAQAEIERIRERERQVAQILAEIERLSIIQREEEDEIAFILMQLVIAE
jgi:hypothetical protein